MGYLFLITFIAVPVIEIALFIQVGSLIGLLPTLATVVLTAVIGTWLLRQQGFAILADARKTMERSEIPLEPVIHGIFLLIAGLLLLTPGFFTDAIGFACLVPIARRPIAGWLIRRAMHHQHNRGDGIVIIDGEFSEQTTREKISRSTDDNG